MSSIIVDELLHLDICSGIGGFALSARWAGFRTVQFVEKEPFCQRVLAKNFAGVPIHGEISDYSGLGLRGRITVATAGLPCQPFSCAGKQLGAKDDRFLWPQMRRILGEVQPRWIVVENVANLLRMVEFDEMLSDLEREGYEVGTFVLPAASVNAPHLRYRVWLVGHFGSTDSHSERQLQLQGSLADERRRVADGDTGDATNATSLRRNGLGTFGGGESESKGEGWLRQPARDDTTPTDSLLAQQWRHERQEEDASGACLSNSHTESAERELSGRTRQGWKGFADIPQSRTDSNGARLQGYREHGERRGESSAWQNAWQEAWVETATRLCSMDDGLPGGLVRLSRGVRGGYRVLPGGEEGETLITQAHWRTNALKAAGNAIVPQCVYPILQTIADIEKGILQ